MAFEEEFGCEIPDDAAEKMTTVKDAISADADRRARRPHAGASLCPPLHAPIRNSPPSPSSSAASASTHAQRRKRSMNCRREITLSFVPYATEPANLDQPRPRARPRSDARTADGAVRSRRRRHRPANAARVGANAQQNIDAAWSNCSRAARAISASPIIRARASRPRRKPRNLWCKRLRRRGLVFITSRHRPTHSAQRRSSARGAAPIPPPTASSMHAARPTPSTSNCCNLGGARSAKSQRHRRGFRVSRDHGAGRPLGQGRSKIARLSTWPPHRPCSMHAPRDE